MIVFPLGLLSTSVIFDVIYLVTGRTGFTVASAYAIAAGLIGGAVAGLFGFVDYLAVPPKTRARRVGALHGGGNVLVLTLFAVSWLLRLDQADWAPSGLAIGFSLTGAALAGVTGWLGGELVERHGVSVADDAGLNAPSSLSQLRTRGGRRVGRPRTP